MTTTSKFQLEVRNAILTHLEMGPASIAQLMDATGFKYHSLRLQVRQLEEEGLVKAVTRSYRNTLFALGSENGPNNIIPVIRTDSQSFKVQELISLRHNNEPAAAKAVLNLPKHITRLMKAALRLNQGTDVALTLSALKTEMKRDLAALKRSVEVYEQVLGDTRNWNPEALGKFPNDITFDEPLVEEAYEHYFKVGD